MTGSTPSPAVTRVLARLADVKRVGTGWRAYCPAHPDAGTKRRGLSIDEGEDGKAVVVCSSRRCSAESIVAALGLTMADLFSKPCAEWRLAGAESPARRGPPASKGLPLSKTPDFPAVVERARALLAERRAAPEVQALLARYHGTVEALESVGGGLLCDEATIRLLFPESDPMGRPCGAKVRPGPREKEEDHPGGRHGLLGQVPDLRTQPSATVLVCEGAHDLLAVLACGRFADFVVVALPGAGFFAEGRGMDWAKALSGREVVLALDSDDAGMKGTAAAVTVLRSAGATVRSLDWNRVLDGGTVAKDLAEVISQAHPAHLDRLVAAVREAPSTGLRFRTVEELRSMPESKVDWIAEEILGVGLVTVIASGFKVGKSVLVAVLMRCLEEGKPFAGFAVPAPVRAVCLSEEAASLILEKCDKYGVREAVFLSREDFDPGRSFREFVEEAAAEARRRRARVLFIDTWRRFSRLAAETEKDSGAVQAAIEVALEVAARERIAVCVLAHHRKMEGEGGTQVAGSYALGAAVDVLIEVRRLKDEKRSPCRVLNFEGRSQSLPSEEMVLELRGAEYLRVGVVEDLRQVRMRDSILAEIDARSPDRVPRTECIAVAGGRPQVAGGVLAALHESGVLTREGRGVSRDPHTFARPCASGRFPSVPVGSGTEVDPGRFSVPPLKGGELGTGPENGGQGAGLFSGKGNGHGVLAAPVPLAPCPACIHPGEGRLHFGCASRGPPPDGGGEVLP